MRAELQPQIYTEPEVEKTAEISVSLNNFVLVRITDRGSKDWYDFYSERSPNCPQRIPVITRDEQGYTKMRICEMINVFGDQLHCDNPRLPIEPVFKLVDSEESQIQKT